MQRCFSGWPYGHGFSPPGENHGHTANQKNKRGFYFNFFLSFFSFLAKQKKKTIKTKSFSREILPTYHFSTSANAMYF
jgi:hypothetical protein